MASNILLNLLTFSIIGSISTAPIYMDKTEPPKKVLQGHVESSKDLPAEFFGSWMVKSQIIQTNRPNAFRARSEDIWTLTKNGDIVTLSNPKTGAIASITVKEVNGNKATFTRRKKTATKIEVEQPQLTINGDSFYGTDTLVFQELQNGVPVSTNIVKYQIKGYKLTGTRLSKIFSK